MGRGPEWVGPRGTDFEIKVDPRIIAIAVVGIILVVWMIIGGPMYTVAPDEEGVVLTFGKYTKTTPPGLHFKMPWPIQTVETPNVTEAKRLEFGFRTQERGGQNYYIDFTDTADLLHEAQMLTGDENVVNCSMSVQYRVSDPVKYLFNFSRESDVTGTLNDIGEAALRQVIGDHPIDHVLTTGKEQIQVEIMDKMQELADLYGTGVHIFTVQLQDVNPPKEVEQAFRAVASAREKREEIINTARGYQREQVPKAEGEAQRVVLEANAYKESQIATARGQASRFQQVAKEYAAAPDITRVRMYLDTMAELLPNVKVTVIDEKAGVINLRDLSAGAGAATKGGTAQ